MRIWIGAALAVASLASMAMAWRSHSVVSGAVQVVDGDTLDLGGKRYRIEGIDAPELSQTCQADGHTYPCGKDARAHLVALTDGHDVQCTSLDTDRYDRVIARCRAGEIDLAASMVRDGHAWAFRRYSDSYLSQEAEAKRARRGFWRGEAQPAWDYRAARWQVAAQKSPNGCPIKGNISDKGRIYHPPWSPWYSRTRISEARGERWFCSEADAIAAGWRRPGGAS